MVLKTAFALIGIGAYLGLYFDQLPMKPFVAVVAIVFGGINLFGARKSGLFQTALVMGLLLLAWFAVKGSGEVQGIHFDHFWAGRLDILAAAGLVCISFMGLTNVASVAEEVKDPERNLSLGILIWRC